jgi:hypothetical protein
VLEESVFGRKGFRVSKKEMVVLAVLTLTENKDPTIEPKAATIVLVEPFIFQDPVPPDMLISKVLFLRMDDEMLPSIEIATLPSLLFPFI